MAFDFSQSVIAQQQIMIINKILDNKYVQGTLGKNLVRNVFRAVFFVYILTDIAYYSLKWQFETFDYTEGVMFVVNAFFLAYIWYKFHDLIKRKEEPQVGIKAISSDGNSNTTMIFNYKWIGGLIQRFGWFSNIFIIFFFISLILFVPQYIADGHIWFAIVYVMQDIYEILVCMPLFVFLHWENPRQSVYSKAKEKITNLADSLRPTPSPIPLPVKV